MNTPAARALGATLIATLAVPALAGSPTAPALEPAVVPTEISAPASDWTGAYAGLQLGYGGLASDSGDAYEGEGWIGGLSAGYDWDLGDWVVGVGADASFGTIETDVGDLNSLSRLKVRGGYEFGRTMLFGTTGVSYAASDDLGDSWGYFGGFGVETRVSEQVSVSVDVSRHWFDELDNHSDVNATVGTIGINYRF